MAGRIGSFRPQTFLAFALALVVGASAAALVVVYATGSGIISERERAEALAERDLLDEVYQEQGLQSLINAVARRTRFSASGERYGVFGPQGQPLAGDLQGFNPAFRDADWRLVRVRRPTPETLHVVAATLDDGGLLVVGRDRANQARFERSVVYGFIAAFLIVAVASGVAGLALNAAVLQRVEAIAATAERIASGDLSARTVISDPEDPFGRIAGSLNAMLDRIEALMNGMRSVTDSVAHDLRSPLTRMKGALARAQHPSTPEPERSEAIAVAETEADRTLATLSALLDIARAESGLSRDVMRPVDLRALMAEVADVFAPVIEDAGQSLTLDLGSLPTPVAAHEALVRQAVGNLLHNAAQHAGEGAEVALRLRDLGALVEIEVADSGPGVPEADRERVQERFVRLDAARSGGGSGLGLAIAAACARLHGGALVLGDAEPGLLARLTLERGAAA